jgi:class 3 adenylate cyclase
MHRRVNDASNSHSLFNEKDSTIAQHDSYDPLILCRKMMTIISDFDFVRRMSSNSDLESLMQSRGSDNGVDAQSVDVQAGTLQSSDCTKHVSGISNGHNSPEELVRRETKVFHVVRVTLFVLLLLAAVGISLFVFHYVHNSEVETYHNEYDAISTFLIGVLLEDISRFFWTGRAASSALTITMDAYNAPALKFAISEDKLNDLTEAFLTATGSPFLTWSPLIRNDNELEEFESFASSLETNNSSEFYPACYVCGSADQGYINPLDEVFFQGYGTFSCGYLENLGRSGASAPALCDEITSAVQGACRCGAIVNATSATQVRSRSQGIFNYKVDRFDQSISTIVDATKTGGPYLPMFQDSQAISNKQPLMYDQLSDKILADGAMAMLVSQKPVMSRSFNVSNPTNYYAKNMDSSTDGPMAAVFHPVISPDGNEVVGALSLLLVWSKLITNTVPKNGELLKMVIESTCNEAYTFQVGSNGTKLSFVGEGNLHDQRYSSMLRQSTLEAFNRIITISSPPVNAEEITDVETCKYLIKIYPTKEFEEQYISNDPIIFAGMVLAVFLFTSAVFFLYDFIVRKRQAKIMAAAIQTNNIVSSLFPTSVRDRLYKSAAPQLEQPVVVSKSGSYSKKQMQSFLSSADQASIFGTDPIADLFPYATVIFIDIANFTAWCSERDPCQVFTLLENLYHEFDKTGEELGIFKVETIGDSYVAVCGLPTPRNDHAVAMVRFASICIRRMDRLVKELEVALGPSTGELRVRVGIHSGPVTAGVLRGAKARFQLFGDTVNTAARMQSSGEPNQIHASNETALLLRKAKKHHWISERSDKVSIKGKGLLQTYWISPNRRRCHGQSSNGTTSSTSDHTETDVEKLLLPTSETEGKHEQTEKLERNQRLVDWNVEVLFTLLHQVVASRTNAAQISKVSEIEDLFQNSRRSDRLVIDELTNVLCLPAFNANSKKKVVVNVSNQINHIVKEQLRDFVWNVANLYRDVPFHNFEHASHVIMSAGKLMKRIVLPDGIEFDDSCDKTLTSEAQEVQVARQIHEVTYGISSDPLMQFAVVFSALIHDVDHTGLTNKELVDTQAPIALAYKEKCVAEQNSVDISWQLLMDDRFKDLRTCIYSTEQELKRFRELIVDAVMATDIADKELQTLRKSRWADAFDEKITIQPSDVKLAMDRKATIVYEHIIQASDVSHCMQHWLTYQKFNARLFEERYVAFRDGKSGTKPPWEGWYHGELWFFDNYIIPLAQKLNDCGVFGVSYHEYLNYAQQNRIEWEDKGEDIVAAWRQAIEEKYLVN